MSPSWRIGSIIGFLGGIEGAIAGTIFLVSQLATFLPALSQMPLGLVLQSWGTGSWFLVLLIVGFVIALIIAFQAMRTTTPNRGNSLIQILIGGILTIVGILAGFTVGPFILPGAILVLLSGILLILASRRA